MLVRVLALCLACAGFVRASEEDPDPPEFPAPPASAPEAPANLPKSGFYDLLQHGAVPGQDCTEALQKAFDTMPQHQLPILLPPGNLLISKTVATPFVGGGMLIGCGRSERTRPDHPLHGGVSALVWTGEAGGTVLKIQGADLEVRDLAVYGRVDAVTPTRAGIGILVTKPDLKGLGSGKHQFSSLQIQDCDVGFQVGERSVQSNCDNLVFGFLRITGCTTGIRVVNLQGMGFKFDYLHTRYVDEGIDFMGGGNLWVDSWKIISGKVGLRLRDVPKAIGSNNASYTINMVKIDDNGGKFKMVQMDGAKPAKITLNEGHIAYDEYSGAPFIEMKGASSLTMRDWYNLQRGMIHAKFEKDAKPNILVERSRLSGGIKSAADLLEGEGYLKLRDCFEGKSVKPMPDEAIEK
ncbi:MAG: hypothetical protein M5U26_24915 [Planctomycetota bacterium]|nr:hypothetical protein [Planctomycetota bacterium]